MELLISNWSITFSGWIELIVDRKKVDFKRTNETFVKPVVCHETIFTTRVFVSSKRSRKTDILVQVRGSLHVIIPSNRIQVSLVSLSFT